MSLGEKIKVGVFIPARNEEKFLPKTLESLVIQDLKPEKIILINDGSIDKTKDIALSFGCKVIDLSNDNFEGQGGPKMTRLHETALSQFDDSYDFILQLDADHIIPNNYISFLVSKMEKNSNIVIGGCKINGLHSEEPWGSGRVVRFDFHKKIGINRRVKYGLDTYPLLKAKQLGYTYKIFEIDTKMQRNQAATYRKENYISIGKTCKSLGYHPKAALILFLKRAINQKKILIFFWQLEGFLQNDTELYDDDFRQYVRNMQGGLIFKKIKKFLHLKINN